MVILWWKLFCDEIYQWKLSSDESHDSQRSDDRWRFACGTIQHFKMLKLGPKKSATECSFECVCVCVCVCVWGGGGGQCPNERGFWFLGASLTSLVRKRNDVPNPAWAWKPLSSPWHVNLPQFRTGHNTSRYGQVEVDSTWMNEKKNLNHQKFRRICWI